MTTSSNAWYSRYAGNGQRTWNSTGHSSSASGASSRRLVLGAILGSMADENLHRSILVNEEQYLEMLMRPIGIVLLLAVIWSFYYGIRRSRRESMRLTAEGQ